MRTAPDLAELPRYRPFLPVRRETPRGGLRLFRPIPAGCYRLSHRHREARPNLQQVPLPLSYRYADVRLD